MIILINIFRQPNQAFVLSIMEKVFFNQPYLQLYFNDETQMAKAVWVGFLGTAEIQTACAACLELLDQVRPYSWLADNRKMKAIRQQDQDWILTHFWPRLAHSSIQKMATLTSTDIFNQMAIENLFSKGSEHIKFDHQYFKTEIEAVKWLTEDLNQNRNMKMA